MYFQYLGFPDEVVFTPRKKVVQRIDRVHYIVKCRNKCIHFLGVPD